MYSNPTGIAGAAPGVWTQVYGIDLTTGDIQRPYTDTSGVPGNATIQTPRGKAAFAAAASTITITSALVSATSRIVCSMWPTKSSSVRVGPKVGATISPVTTSRLPIKVKVPWRLYSNSRSYCCPGCIGNVAATRTNAWMPVISSTHRVCVS